VVWSKEEVETLSNLFKVRPGVRLHHDAEDYHFPDKTFISDGYAPPGGYVKDFGVVLEGGRLHLFHIDGRPGEVCYVTGNEISFGHASTADYCRWIRHCMPLAIGDRTWENLHVWAPYVYRRGDLYYMFYTGMGRGPGESSVSSFISYATSTDLQSWMRWADGPIKCASGRDPFVFDHDESTVLLYTGRGSARISACTSRDMVAWESLPDILNIPGGTDAESCSLHPLQDRYVLWFNDYGPRVSGFRAAYALSEDPFHFDPAAIREFQFVTNHPQATPSAELPVSRPVPLSIELISACNDFWFVAYFRWHVDRNRLFFGSLDWSSDPAVIKEINDKNELDTVLQKVGMNDYLISG
jgi:hypothetical protein